MANKRKLISAVIAVALAAAILMGGTFAWQSISQMALNEVAAHVNPGGRLHDDFTIIEKTLPDGTKELVLTQDGTKQYDKNVYAENFTTVLDDGVQIFARIRLDEYMEIGPNAGVEGNDTATSLVYDAELDDKSTWTTHIPGNTNDPFHDYWDWTMAGQGEDGTLGATQADGVWYMPTFNKNKDSLQADINGTFDAGFADYVDYEQTDNAVPVDGKAVYDADDNDVDEIVANNYTTEYAAQCGHVTVKEESHHVAQTLPSTVITMADWLNLPDEEKSGNYWVWDIDGWAYWAAPIDPDSATGVFLDGIARTEKIINEDWYYGINVVAQFITVEDIGDPEEGTGFYDLAKGDAPSFNALKLLSNIGVKVNTEAATPEALHNALAIGGNITVNGTITSTTAASFGNADADFTWATGGTLTGGSLTTAESAYAGVFINSEKDWPNEGDGANEAIMNGTTINAENTNYGLYIQAIDNDVTLNKVTVTAQNGGIYAEWSKGGKVTLNEVTVTAQGEHATHWVNAAVAVANGANMEINGGTYKGNYAAYVYSSGGTITINDGYFDGKLACDAGEIIIKGGTFDHDPGDYVPEGYSVTKGTDAEGNASWTVSKFVF